MSEKAKHTPATLMVVAADAQHGLYAVERDNGDGSTDLLVEAVAKADALKFAAVDDLLQACKAAFYSEVGRRLAYAVESAGWIWPDDAPATVSILAESLRTAIAKAQGV